MSFSRAGFRRRAKKDEQDNPGLRFLYSEAVAKVLWKYSSCVDTVCKKYPASYPYKDNSELTIQNLPHLEEHYEEIAVIPASARGKVPASRGPRGAATDVGRRQSSFVLPRIGGPSGRNTGQPGRTTREGTTASVYHKRCLDRRVGGDCAFLTERRSAYHSRRIPAVLGTPPPFTFSNRKILEKLWTERVPLCAD